MIDDAYSLAAKHYDAAYSTKVDLVDRDFYLDLAGEYGGPVFELGCGTGRITLPFARQGVDVTGLDASRAMLEVLRAKLAKEPAGVRRRVRVVEGDFRTLCLGDQFPLVVIPFRPMQHMYTVEDQLAALTNAGRHLKDGGVLAFDVFNPRFDKLLSGDGEEHLELEWPDGDGTGQTIRRFFVKDGFDPVNMGFAGRFIFRLYEGGRVVSEEEEPFRMSVYTYPHLKALFHAAGLETVGEFGSFDRKPIGPNAPEVIFLLKRRQSL